MNPLFEQIDQLKKDWASAQPLSAEAERKLWQKIRLDWNYHSNHIEGNTLTYGETQLLLLHGQTHGDHQLREYEEMKAHDVGIAHVRELAKDPRFIGEGDVRNLNQIILKEPFWKDARTADGQPSRKQIIPGEYKTTPNNVITATGELFEFASPADVPIRMRELLTQLEERLGDGTSHIAEVITWFHHQFVLIHPFDDGNGRVARLLVNYLLLRGGYLPIIVPTEEKATYLGALRLADAGETSPFADYLGQRIKSALEMGIRASKGQSIEEPGDLEKEIQLFIRHQQPHLDSIQPPTVENIRSLYIEGIEPFIESLAEGIAVFSSLFLKTELVNESHSSFDELLMKVQEGNISDCDLHWNLRLRKYLGRAERPYDVSKDIRVRFRDLEYDVGILGDHNWDPDQIHVHGELTKKYSQPLLSEEVDMLLEALKKAIFQEIKERSL